MIVEPLTSVPSRFSSLKHVLVGRTETKAFKRSITTMDVREKGIRVSLGDVNSRNDAEELIGSFLFVSETDRVPLSPGSYFVDELVGARVVDEQGAEIGTVKEVLKMPAQDVYVVEHEGKETMIPAVAEFVLRIDLSERIMVVRMIEGLENL
jgi:16S rRNA processing protein RimM